MSHESCFGPLLRGSPHVASTRDAFNGDLLSSFWLIDTLIYHFQRLERARVQDADQLGSRDYEQWKMAANQIKHGGDSSPNGHDGVEGRL
jgi:hypothetical protein